jgi:hypothetical protein
LVSVGSSEIKDNIDKENNREEDSKGDISRVICILRLECYLNRH